MSMSNGESYLKQITETMDLFQRLYAEPPKVIMISVDVINNFIEEFKAVKEENEILVRNLEMVTGTRRPGPRM